MVCGKCNYEFCWDCLGHYPNYNHAEFTFCPIRKLLMHAFIVYFLFQSINGKICMLSDTITQYEVSFFDWVVLLIAANIYAGIGLMFFLLLSETMNYYSMMGDFDEWAISCRTKFCWYLIYSFVYLASYASWSVVLFIHSEYFWSMLKFLCAEAVILIILLLLVAIVLCFVSVYKGAFGQAQEIAQPQEYYQNYDSVNGYNSLALYHPSFEEPLIPSSVENREEEKRLEDRLDYEGLSPKQDIKKLELADLEAKIQTIKEITRKFSEENNRPLHDGMNRNVSETI